MQTIQHCLIKHPYSDRAGLLAEAKAYEERGLSSQEAIERALVDRIDEVQGQLTQVAQSIIEAYGKAYPDRFAKLKPVAEEAQNNDMEKFILVAADSIAKLRKVDVLRVLESNPQRRDALAQYIIDERPDLADEVRGVMEDEFGAATMLDLKGFDIRKAADGFLTLRDGDLLVEATPTAEGRYQASIPGASVRSSPHLQGVQGAVDWAAAYREEAQRAAAKQAGSELVARYVTAGGKDALSITKHTFGNGNVTYSFTGQYGAGSTSDEAHVRTVLERTKKAHPGMKFADGEDWLAEAKADPYTQVIHKAGSTLTIRHEGKPLTVTVRNDWTEGHRRSGSPISTRSGGMVAKVIEVQPDEIVLDGNSSARDDTQMPVGADDLSALFDEVLAEEIGQGRHDELDAEMRSYERKAARSRKTSETKQDEQTAVPRTATQSAASAAKNTAAGLSDTISALGALFKPKPGTLRSGIGWDEDTYRAAKPLFQQAIAHFKDAGQDLKEAMRAIVRMVLDQFGADTAANMKPYVVRFMEDVRDGKINYDETVTQDQEEAHEPTGNDRGDESALAPVSPAGVQDASGGASPGEGSDGGRGSDAGGNGRAGEDVQDHVAGGLGGSAGTVLPEEPDTVKIGGETKPLDEVAESVKNDPPASEPKPKFPARFGDNPGNFRIVEPIGTGTAGERIRANMAAVRLVLALEQENRYPTREEQAVLSRYVGWGGLKNVFKGDNSTSKQERDAHAELKRILTPEQLFWMGQSVLDAHYTSAKVVGAMYKVLGHFGIDGGRFLEPTVGVGNFIGLMPDGMASGAKWYASEIDPITSLIAKNLYPDAQILPSTGFQDAEFAYGRMDVAIGNPPFGDQRITDNNKKRADISGFKIHNYILSKSAMHLRPGGIMAFVVTSRFLDTANPEARDYLSKNFRFLGAFRLPNNSFAENAGTEVTTDLIFLQRMHEGQREGDDSWLDTNGRMLNEDGETVTLNRYFADNPGQMLGKPSMHGTMYGGNKEKGEFTLDPIPGLDIDQEISRILAENWADYEGIGRPRKADLDEMAAGMEFNREDVPLGGYYLDNGRVVQRIDDDTDGNTQFRQLTPETPWTEKQTLGVTRMERITGMLELRGMAYDLMAAERGDMGTDFIEGKRQLLNEKYDAFVEKHGFLNDRANRYLMEDDPRIEFGLEADYTKEITEAAAKRLGQSQAPAKATKTSLLKERVFFPKQEVLSADTPHDGYAVSLAEKGKLDLDYISELTGQSVEKVIEALSSGDSPLIYRDPVLMRWVQEDEYLSGNVKDKLKAARGAGIAKNIKALEAVQPPDVAPHDIHAEFGATWIRPSIYEDFLKMLGYDAAQVAVLPKSGTVDAVSVGRGTASPFRADLENPDYTLDQVFSHVANRRQMVAYDGRGDDRTMNPERTEQLGRIRNKLIAIWTDWIKSDPERSTMLARDYNELMNTTIERRYDGVKHLVTVGANPSTSLRNSQKNASWRMIQSSIVLLDHVVGAGKTMALTTGIMERKRLGLSKKPMVVVPNHLVGQWARDWLALYPGANILAATEKDFASQNRRRLFARIATGKYDAVIVGHSSFGFIPVSKENEVQFIMSEVKHLEDALSEAEAVSGKSKKGGDSRQVRAIKNRIAKRMEKIKELQDKPRDNVVTFEDMGIDYLAVDELHEFKNLEYATTLSNVAGMGSPQGSKKAFDMFMKMRLLQEWGGGIAGATGTPISNSMVEMYSLLRYLNPGALASRGMEQFDAWVKAFASIEPRDEYTAAGKVKQRTVLAAFNNLPELLQMYKQFADTITMTDLKRITAEQIREENRIKGTRKREEFPVPKVTGGGRRLDIGAPTAEQQEFMDYLIARADILDQKKGKAKQEYASIDNALWLMSDARKMSLDVRIIDPTAPDNPGNKVNRAAAQIKAIYDRTDADLGTQLVFCDLSTPSKHAAKDAKAFIKKAMETLGLEKDAAAKDALVGKSYRDQWSYLALRADAMLDSGTLKDAKRESIEEFMESVGDDALSALQTADIGFSVYDDLKAKLIGLGVPEREIAFIHDATTSDKKKELFDLVNAGKVRVLLGSSVKMGAGTNVQQRAVALHHMDAPWRPSDIEQREGRVIRQGNMFYERDPDKFAVDIIAYSTERTFDAQMWGVLARKAAFLEQFRKGLRSIKEEGSDADSYAEFMATATGDEIFRTKLQTERELDDLEAEDRSSKMKRAASEQIVKTAVGKRADLEAKLARANALAGADLSSATFEGKTYRNDLMQVFEEEVAAYNAQKAEYDKEEEAYKVARKAWEDAAGTERGKPPAKPKAPSVPALNSDGVVARSEWAQLVDVLTKRMEMVGKDQRRTFELKAANDISIPFAVQRSNWNDSDIVLILDGQQFVSAQARSPSMAAFLTSNKILGELRSRPSGITSDMRSLEANVKQAQITLEHVKPVDPAAIAEVKARYEAVKKAVDDASARLAEERAKRSNRFIARDRVRFGQAHAAAEVAKQAVRPVPAEARFSNGSDGVQYRPNAKDVSLEGSGDFRFFAYKNEDNKQWYVVEHGTGLSMGGGHDTRKSAIERAQAEINARGLEKFTETVAKYAQTTEAQKREAFDKANPPSVLRQSDANPGAVDRISGAEADGFLRDFTATYPNAPQIVAVERFADLPPAVRQDARNQGSGESNTKGAFHKGTVYVVTGNHATMADFQATVFHEVLGHAGVRQLFGPGFVQELNKLFIGLGGVEGLAKIMKGRGMERQFREYIQGVAKARGADARVWNDAMAKAVLTEEVFAHIAEKPQLLDRFMALIGAIRDWLRKHTFLELANLGTTDMLHMLRQARDGLGGNGPKGGVSQDGGTVFSFAGKNAKTADKFALATALERLDAGENADTVRQDTGWFFGPDGKARFEINDRDASLKDHFANVSKMIGSGRSLGSILDHPKLFAAYPAFANISVNTQKGAGASISTPDGIGLPTIRIGEDVQIDKVASVLLHEVQHAIQRSEGFATGTNLSAQLNRYADDQLRLDELHRKLQRTENAAGDEARYASQELRQKAAAWAQNQGEWYQSEPILDQIKDYILSQDRMYADWYKERSELAYGKGRVSPENRYRRSAGEVEARNVQTRMKMTDEERRGLAPNWTTDVADGDVIVSFNGKDMAMVPAWHGSPHTFDKFSLDKIGTGEGAQAYGHGLYFAGSKEVAEWYRNNLSGGDTTYVGTVSGDRSKIYIDIDGKEFWLASRYRDPDENADVNEEFYWTESADDAYDFQQSWSVDPNVADQQRDAVVDQLKKRGAAVYPEAYRGRLYSVELAPAEDEYLLWDKPLSEQSEKVKAALRGKDFAGADVGMSDWARDGNNLYSKIARDIGGQKAASDYLHSIGIRGIKYLDGTSRGKGDGNYNYVIFDDKDVKIASVFRLATDGGRDAPRTLRTKLADIIGGFTGESAKTFNWWQRSVGSQYGKSKSDPQHFGRVYQKAHDFLDDVRRFATESADLAKNILPHLDDLKDIASGLNVRKQWADAKDYQAIAPAIFEGTLENGTTGRVWTDRELRERFDLNDKQVGLYHEFRAAVDHSLETLASSEMARAARAAKLEVADPGMSMDEAADYYAGQVQPAIDAAQAAIDGLKLRHQYELEELGMEEIDETYDLPAMKTAKRQMEMRQAAELAEAKGVLQEMKDLQDSFADKASRIRQLQNEGYAPLMRFGQYTVDVVRKDEDGNIVKNDDGEPDRPFFGMFETEAEAIKADKILREEYPGYEVTRGVLSTNASQLYKGLTPETAELFGRLLGTDESGAFQAYLKQAVANRSAMKRLIQRQGMEGFATDVPRVLSAFIASSARLASGNWHFGELSQAVQNIPKEKGDVKDEAIRLMQYIQNPQEEAQVLRGFLFFNFLGGSLASAAVNLTQSLTTTLPYLSKFGGAKVVKVLPSAMKLAGKMMTKGLDAVQDADLKAALHRASDDGTVDPQEIHLLMAESGGGGGVLGRAAGAIKKEWANPASRVGRAFAQAWGSMFGMAEKYNRHVAFIAAWEMAPEGVDRYEFAKQAVTETQFEYSKVNRPNWARGAIGATLFTFKTFTINYIEFLSRLPSRERALALAVLMLLAGLSGAPGGDDLDDLMDTIGQKMGYNWNTAGARHAWLMKTLGQGGANFVEHGVSSLLPLDVSSRLGMGNLIPGTGILQKSNQSPSREVGEFFGPAGSLVMGARDVFDSVGSGKGVGDTLRPVLPKMVNDAMQAVDMAQTGQYRDYKGRKVVDVDAVDALIKSVGFQPNAVAEPRRVERMVAQTAAMQRAIKSDINELWARGKYEGDEEKLAAAKEMLRRWNEKNPETPIRINPTSIAQRVRAMRSSSADRLVKATPKEIRGVLSAELQEN